MSSCCPVEFMWMIIEIKLNCYWNSHDMSSELYIELAEIDIGADWNVHRMYQMHEIDRNVRTKCRRHS